MAFSLGFVSRIRSSAVDVRAAAGSSTARYKAIRDDLARRIHPSHVVFLERLLTSFQTPTHFFAHAGARPGTALDQQTTEDLLWIREGFADRDIAFEKIIVHGHTPVDKPYFGKHRINLDTGAYFTNRLSCLVIEEGTARLLDHAHAEATQ